MFGVLRIVRNVVRRLQWWREDRRYVVRRGVSPEVMDAAERLMKEYQSDLDYLKDR